MAWDVLADAVPAGDLGSYGVVRTVNESEWEPRAVFEAVAARCS